VETEMSVMARPVPDADLPEPKTRLRAVEELTEVAARGLEGMLDSASGLFCCRTERSDSRDLRPLGKSLRYSLISLLGLHRHKLAGGRTPIDVEGLLARYIQQGGPLRLGDLSLLLWACADILPERVGSVCRAFRVGEVLEVSPEAPEVKTMEFSWLLSGLTRCWDASPQESGLADLCRRVYHLLMGNYVARTGLFRHQGKGTWTGRLRGRFANFADQIYPVQALERFSRSFPSLEAMEAATSCARTLCRLQGPLGQWWWHYDAVTGRVLRPYPVYSVHQHAMAPMALLPLAEATGQDFRTPAYRGLAWVMGRNELGIDMTDRGRNLIWRSIVRTGVPHRFLEEGLAFMCLPTGGADRLIVKYECRPYCLGWLLYALAG
jgi:hypothetical protein